MKPVNTNLANKFNFRSLLEGGLYVAVSIVLLVALASYSPHDPSFNKVQTHASINNLLGTFGAYTSDIVLQIFGFTSSLIVLLPLCWGVQKICSYPLRFMWFRFVMLLSSLVLSCITLGKIFHAYKSSAFKAGGALGYVLNIHLSNIEIPCEKAILIATSMVAIFLASGITLKALALGTYYLCLHTVEAIKLLLPILKAVVGIIAKMHTKLFSKDESILYEQELMSSPAKVQESENDFRPLPQIRKPREVSGSKSNYTLPGLDLLNTFKRPKSSTSEKLLQAQAEELLVVLSDFGVRGRVVAYSVGPVVTLFEFEPAAGTKSSRVVGLADDIARTMKVVSTRISVIPGKNSLGIELPNAQRETVYLRELIESQEYIDTSCRLPLVLGKDISGNPVIADLTSMPHLLVAGTTGSGKSVGINTMILSLLFKYTPDECKFVMIDPKMLELSVYQNIPHLLAPVVTESAKAVTALKWTVKEMENRYRLMSALGVRNIEGYNQRVQEAVDTNTDIIQNVQSGVDHETGVPMYEKVPIAKNKLPLIVVIVDEMADLMIVAGKEIESSIQRLAQMARAAGIHIIMATQRPSVDVITGVIKANFPTRISFQVTSKIDSRTILAEVGAEQLLGKGDMLYMSGGNRIRRVHCPFVADSEVEKVVNFCKSQSRPKYFVDITQEQDDITLTNLNSSEKDELYDEALVLVLREKKVSTSYLQRCFKIGYNRAALIIEQMEKRGVIGQANHVGKREILVDN